MLKNMKAKALALLTALAMMLGLGAITSAPAFATESAGSDGSITVTGNAGFTGISVYQMFSENENADGTTGYVLTEAWKGFFIASEAEGGMDLENNDKLSDNAYSKVKGLGTDDAEEVSAFAKKAAAWATKPDSLSPTKSSNETTNAGDGKIKATVSDLAYGYYLVVPNPKGSTDQTEPFRGTDAMLVNVNSTDHAYDAELKTEYPTISKTVENDEGSDVNGTGAQVGDELTFTLSSKVPDMSEYDSYVFTFHDTLSEGLTFKKASVQVYINGELVENTDGSQYTVTEPTSTYGGDLKVEMKDFKTKHQADAGKGIKVVYKATLNARAVTDDPMTGTWNDAYIEYSNNPGSDGTGETGHDKVYVYDFEFTLNKTDGTNPLSGATFKLLDSRKQEVTLFKINEGVYRPAVDTDSPTTTTVETGASGKIEFRGLDEGTYYLHEETAPDGYNKLTEDVQVTIEAKYDEDGKMTSYTVTNGDGNHEVGVVNHAGATLPGTGGIGTVIFTVAGLVLVVAGVAWAMRRRQRD